MVLMRKLLLMLLTKLKNMKIDNKKDKEVNDFSRDLQMAMSQYHSKCLSESIKRGLKAKKEREVK